MSRGYPQECEGVKRAELKQPNCNGNLAPNGGAAGYTSLLLADTDRQTARSVLVTEHTILGHSGYRPRLVALLVLFLVLLFTSLSGLVFYFNSIIPSLELLGRLTASPPGYVLAVPWFMPNRC
ncbi:hypothetical protein O3M35_001848 [Rhynocoris fuscipes]|uniref:Uncharacterized protein n=1 Tax=Rhynocoris fuscipes TaxID=488301 RepID=A0AAW1CUU3_9HEMI